MKSATAPLLVAPTIWWFLGYPFEAASMLAGLLACLVVRLYLGAKNHSKEGWMVDGSVTALSLLVTAGFVIFYRPVPFYAIIAGTGIGAIGAGIITIAERWVRRIGDLADDTHHAKDPVDDDEAIRRIRAMMERGDV